MKKPSPPAKRARRIDRIDAILQAAQDIFLEVGYEATSLDDVAGRANASKATIYAHFGNKMGLFEAIVHAIIERLQFPLHDPRLAAAPAADVLTKVGTGFLNLLLTPAPLAFYRLIVNKGHDVPDLAKLWFESGPRTAIAGLAAFLAERTKSGELDVPDPEIAAEFFLMSLRGTLHMQALTGLLKPPFDTAISAKVRAAVALMIRAYGRPAPVSPSRRTRL